VKKLCGCKGGRFNPHFIGNHRGLTGPHAVLQAMQSLQAAGSKLSGPAVLQA